MTDRIWNDFQTDYGLTLPEEQEFLHRVRMMVLYSAFPATPISATLRDQKDKMNENAVDDQVQVKAQKGQKRNIEDVAKDPRPTRIGDSNWEP